MTEEELENKAAYIFGDKNVAKAWMLQPKREFGNRTPLETLRIPGGIEMIEQWIRRMQEGFYY